jgi:hypothetical protein
LGCTGAARDQRGADRPDPPPAAAELDRALPGLRHRHQHRRFPHRPGDGCAPRPSFLDQIPVVEVLDEVLDLLDRTSTDAEQAR